MLKKLVGCTLAGVFFFTVGQSIAAESIFSSESEKAAARVVALSKINIGDVIAYPAKNLKVPKAVVTIFTDMDCTYCRKLHHEIPKVTELGIEVRYVAYPRHGKGSDTYNKMVTVWCSVNPNERKKMMEQAMEGEALAPKTCEHRVDDHRLLGRQLGLSGTPTLVFADGTVWSGYVPAERLAREAIKHGSRASGGDSKNAYSTR